MYRVSRNRHFGQARQTDAGSSNGRVGLATSGMATVSGGNVPAIEGAMAQGSSGSPQSRAAALSSRRPRGFQSPRLPSDDSPINPWSRLPVECIGAISDRLQHREVLRLASSDKAMLSALAEEAEAARLALSASGIGLAGVDHGLLLQGAKSIVYLKHRTAVCEALAPYLWRIPEEGGERRSAYALMRDAMEPLPPLSQARVAIAALRRWGSHGDIAPTPDQAAFALETVDSLPAEHCPMLLRELISVLSRSRDIPETCQQALQALARLPLALRISAMQEAHLLIRHLPDRAASHQVLLELLGDTSTEQVTVVLQRLSLVICDLPEESRAVAFDQTQRRLELLPEALRLPALVSQASAVVQLPEDARLPAFRTVLNAAQALPSAAYRSDEDRKKLGNALARSIQRLPGRDPSHWRAVLSYLSDLPDNLPDATPDRLARCIPHLESELNRTDAWASVLPLLTDLPREQRADAVSRVAAELRSSPGGRAAQIGWVGLYSRVPGLPESERVAPLRTLAACIPHLDAPSQAWARMGEVLVGLSDDQRALLLQEWETIFQETPAKDRRDSLAAIADGIEMDGQQGRLPDWLALVARLAIHVDPDPRYEVMRRVLGWVSRLPIDTRGPALMSLAALVDGLPDQAKRESMAREIAAGARSVPPAEPASVMEALGRRGGLRRIAGRLLAPLTGSRRPQR